MSLLTDKHSLKQDQLTLTYKVYDNIIVELSNIFLSQKQQQLRIHIRYG